MVSDRTVGLDSKPISISKYENFLKKDVLILNGIFKATLNNKWINI